ncbi:MAG: S-layer homology domain-containing protein [Firmicutes bacterium]|nr:S-layer homology domain-containing protein [Bacillota bacterium]
MNSILKKAAIFVAVSAMVFSSIASAASFTDMPDGQSGIAIENAVKNGLLHGYDDNTVRPDNNITRAEMAVIITNACKVTKLGDISSFTDVAADSWYHDAMAQAYEMGAFSGDGDKMHPENNITFQECFTILANVFELLPPYTGKNPSRVYDTSVLNTYYDATEVADWAKPYVAGVVINGGWKGTNGKLTPTAYITRAQFAVVMDNLIKNYIDEPGTYTEINENTMIRCDGVVLDNVTSNHDIYVSDNVSPNGLTVNSITSNKRFVVRGCATPIKGAEGKLTAGDVGLSVTGHFENLRIVRPYIHISVAGATWTKLYNTTDSSISLGNVPLK